MFFLLLIVGMIFPFAGIIFGLAYFNQFREPFRAALLQGVSWSAALYGYIGDQGNDIYRHMSNLSLYKDLPFYQCFDVLASKHLRAVYTWDIWSWVMARFDNHHLLQSSGALVGYAVISYILFDYFNNNDFETKEWIPIWVFVISITSPLNYAVGIRYANAFAIFCLAVYLYYFRNNKVLTVLFCIVAVFLHHGVLLPLLCWILVPLLKKHRFIFSIVFVILLFTFNNYGYYLSQMSGGNGVLSDLVSNTMFSAAAYQENGINNSFHAIVSRTLIIIFNVSLVIRTRGGWKEVWNNGEGKAEYNVWNLSLLLTIASICMILLIGSNGSRFFFVSDLFTALLLIYSRGYIPPYRSLPYGLFDWIILLTAFGNLALSLYDMNWGTGSLPSFLLSLVFGYSTRWLFPF